MEAPGDKGQETWPTGDGYGYHSKRRPRRKARSPEESSPVPPAVPLPKPVDVITPAAPRLVIFNPGLPQLGWFKMLVAENRHRARTCSVMAKFLAMPLSTIQLLGPTITPFADVPYCPGVGAPNAPTLNQLPTVGLGRFGLLKMFGRMVTCGGVVWLVLNVPVGSLPVKRGVRNMRVWKG